MTNAVVYTNLFSVCPFTSVTVNYMFGETVNYVFGKMGLKLEVELFFVHSNGLLKVKYRQNKTKRAPVQSKQVERLWKAKREKGVKKNSKTKTSSQLWERSKKRDKNHVFLVKEF